MLLNIFGKDHFHTCINVLNNGYLARIYILFYKFFKEKAFLSLILYTWINRSNLMHVSLMKEKYWIKPHLFQFTCSQAHSFVKSNETFLEWKEERQRGCKRFMGKSDLIFETIKSLRKLILFVRKLYITPDSTEFKSYYIIKLNCMPNLIENIKPCFIVTNS